MSVAAPPREIHTDSHPSDQLMRAERLPHILCPGCGIGSVIHCYVDAIAASGIPENRHVCVSGIGCSGRAAGYVNVNSYHTTHGRSIPFALGISVYNPELHVTVISGDGDLTSIGGNHFIHAARRNVALLVICINNFNYGMTGGQAGPTTPLSAMSSTTPFGCWERPFNLPHLAHAVGASYVARWTVLHVRQLRNSILRGMQKEGFRFIEVLSPCPTGFGRPNDIGDGLMEMQNYMRRCEVRNGPDLHDIDIDLTHPDSSIIVGDFIDLDRPSFRPIISGPVPKIPSPESWAMVKPTQIKEEPNGK